jgi:hypothetical protein
MFEINCSQVMSLTDCPAICPADCPAICPADCPPDQYCLMADVKIGPPKRHQIEKFRSDNFFSWKIRMQLILEDLVLWSEGGTPYENRESWREIMFAVDDENMSHIQDTVTGCEAWIKLESLHEKTGMNCTMRKKKKSITTNSILAIMTNPLKSDKVSMKNQVQTVSEELVIIRSALNTKTQSFQELETNFNSVQVSI